MKKVIVKRRHPGHPWVFSNEVIRAEEATAGSVVRVEEHRRLIGTAFYNPHSLIALRFLTDDGREFNEELIRTRLDRARQARCDMGNSHRLVYSESDGLPGLIVDRYQDYLVVQVNCRGMEAHKETVFKILQELCSPRGIYEKSDEALRRLEDLEPLDRVVSGDIPDRIEIEQDNWRFLVDVRGGQKTGFFFDQRANRRAASDFARGEILDAFCYTGGFSLYTVGRGQTLGIDSSEAAIAIARENARLNGLPCQFENADAITTLRRYANEGRTFDTVILDPPSFTKSRKKKFDALRGYKEINLRAMRLLEAGGVLVTCSCSHHVDQELFREMLIDAAWSAGRQARLLEMRSQSRDHPMLLAAKESQYLKCAILSVE